jgi:ribosomal protein S27AE
VEERREYPIERFDPLLRDLIGWGLVERDDSHPGISWRLVGSAQRRLDELSPPRAAGHDPVVYLDRRCAECQQRGMTRLHDERYVCDRCWSGRLRVPEPVAPEPSPAGQSHFWRRSRQRQTTPLAS